MNRIAKLKKYVHQFISNSIPFFLRSILIITFSIIRNRIFAAQSVERIGIDRPNESNLFQ